jgi:hypothetical protein
MVSGPGPPAVTAAAGAAGAVPPSVLQAHLSALPVSWPASRPVLGLSGSTIQAAAAAAAAAAASATRAAMGSDPTLGWTPAMAAAAMVAAAGAHEGAAATAVNAAAAAGRRHGHHATRGRRHKLAAKDEDISSRQGSLRILGSASAGHATRGVSAELSDAAQPAPAAAAGSTGAAAQQPQCAAIAAGDGPRLQGMGQPGSTPVKLDTILQQQQQSPAHVGVAGAKDPQQQLQQLIAARLAAQQQAAAEQQALRPAGVPPPAGLLAAAGRGLVAATAGLSSGPAAAEVKGLVCGTPRDSALGTDEPEGQDNSTLGGTGGPGRPAAPAVAEVGSVGVGALSGSLGGSPRLGAGAAVEQHPAAATATGSPPRMSPAAAGAAEGPGVLTDSPQMLLHQLQQDQHPHPASAEAPAAAAGGAVGLGGIAATDELSRQFQQQQLLQQRMCLAALGPLPSRNSGGVPQQNGVVGLEAAAAAAANPTVAGSGPVTGGTTVQQHDEATGSPAAVSAHWPPLSLQQALNTAAQGLSLPTAAVAGNALSPAAALVARRASAAVSGAAPQPVVAVGCLPLQLVDPSLPLVGAAAGGDAGVAAAAAAAAAAAVAAAVTAGVRVPAATGPEVLLPQLPGAGGLTSALPGEGEG